MTICDAIAKAKKVLLQNTGIDSDPDFVTLVRDKGRPESWLVCFSPWCFPVMVERLKKGAVIDGGEYNIKIDCESGEATIIDVG